MQESGFRAYANSALDAAARKRRIVGLVTLALWIITTVTMFAGFQVRPTRLNLLGLVLLLALFVVVHIQATLMAWNASHDSTRMLALIYSARYLSEVKGVPARERFLADLDQEMRSSREAGPVCTLVVTRLAELDRIREKFGDHFAQKAVEQLGAHLRRVTRGGDLLGYVGDGAFATLLIDCNGEESEQFRRRIPLVLPVESHTERTEPFLTEVRCREYDRQVEDPVDFLALTSSDDEPVVRLVVQDAVAA
jgi:GGDEF domain-containing protein